jgi:hypothetical protein
MSKLSFLTQKMTNSMDQALESGTTNPKQWGFLASSHRRENSIASSMKITGPYGLPIHQRAGTDYAPWRWRMKTRKGIKSTKMTRSSRNSPRKKSPRSLQARLITPSSLRIAKKARRSSLSNWLGNRKLQDLPCLNVLNLINMSS